MSSDSIQNNHKKIWDLFLLLTILEGTAAEAALFLIERDAKNARLFGFSASRLALIGLIFVLLLFFLYLLLNRTLQKKIIDFLHALPKSVEVIKWVGIFFILFLWFAIWMPASRLGLAAATFTRVQPFLIWLGLIGAQTYLFIKIIRQELNTTSFLASLRENKKLVLLSGGLVLLSAIVYALLAHFTAESFENQLFFPPGAPLSGLQVFLGWLLFVCLYLIENKKSELFNRRFWVWITFFAIWVITIALWASTPFPCTDDRPGPYPPNNVCYPQINDAVYSIGSHYITLGQGIYHQWPSDKPLYMVFLAIGQWIFGPTIDRYLLFQIIVLALIPALLFLLGKKMMGYAGGLFLAALAVIQQIYSISMYKKLGSISVKLENPESLTVLLLILLCLTLFEWFRTPERKIWVVLSGGVLGLAILVRFNSVLILPFVILAVIFAARKNKRAMITGLCLFVLAFGLASVPGLFTERAPDGSSYFISKAQGILANHISSDSQTAAPQTGANSTMPTATSSPAAQSETGLIYAADVTDRGGSIEMFYHFINNNFSSLAKLPTELFFMPMDEQVESNIWNFKVNEPIWQEPLTAQNLLSLLLSLVLVTAGIVTASKKFGWAGLSALVIQQGYFIGNTAAGTSGGRYLEPVIWVTCLYYVIGLYGLAVLLISLARKEFAVHGVQPVSLPDLNLQRNSGAGWKMAFPLVGFLLLGLVLPISNRLPNRLPAQSGASLNEAAYQRLAKVSSITEAQWQTFLSDPKSLVVEGAAYQPRYYRSKFFLLGTPSFETMVLGKDDVVVSYMLDVDPKAYFSEGSNVILIGCHLADDGMWSAKRTVMRTYVLFQTDHEQSTYLNDNGLPVCSAGQ